MNINNILKLERERRGISITELSEKTEIPEYILKKLEEDEFYATQNPYGKLYAKKVLRFFDIELKEDKENIQNISSHSPKLQTKILDVAVSLTPHILAFFVMIFFVYANATYPLKKLDVKINQVIENVNDYKNLNEENGNPKTIDHIVLKSEGDVWITLTIDGEKSIINLKEGETKTIYFKDKVSFETIGNANKLNIIFDGKETKIDSKEIIHNVFVDSEGIFYNGYDILRGVPKI